VDIAKENSKNVVWGKLPYELGIITAQIGGWVSLPLVFSYAVAKPFNEYLVTSPAPDPEDVQTLLEIGSWTWGWMEPPLGTISFFLLCMQFVREQRVNLGHKPWTDYYKSKQATILEQAYPQYNRYLLRDYSKACVFSEEARTPALCLIAQPPARLTPALRAAQDADGLDNEPPWLIEKQQARKEAAAAAAAEPKE
jgi:hypothetical protein